MLRLESKTNIYERGNHYGTGFKSVLSRKKKLLRYCHNGFLMWASCQPLSTSHNMASSTASAQPMSQLSDFQPNKSLQEAQWEPTTMPIPHDEEASTQMSGSQSGNLTREQTGLGKARV